VSGWLNLVPLYFTMYLWKNTRAALSSPEEPKPAAATCRPSYTRAERLRIVFELGIGVASHVALFLYLGSWELYLWAGFLPLMGGGAGASAYLITNHHLNPMMSEPIDQVLGTASLEVHPVFDWMHHHFSHHTEHHLFPAMSSVHYPLVRRLLRERYPERYLCVTWPEAMRRLWKSERFFEVPAPASTSTTRS
jgi:fatty acid desaturase